MKFLTTLLLLPCLLAPTSAIAQESGPPQPTSFSADEIAATMAAVRATAAEQRWRLIPFRRSLTEALTTGERENKPVFFFGYDGMLDSGNC